MKNIHLQIGPFTRRIELVRVRSNSSLILETRDFQSETLQIITAFAFDVNKASEIKPGEIADVLFGGGDEQFVLTIKRL